MALDAWIPSATPSKRIPAFTGGNRHSARLTDESETLEGVEIERLPRLW